MAFSTITIPVSTSFGGSTQFGFWMSATPPPVAFHGQPWLNTDTGILSVYYDDGSTQQWIRPAGT